MEESTAVREAVLDFYRGVSAKAVERFDDIVSAEAATLVIGTAPGGVGDRAAAAQVRLRDRGSDARARANTKHGGAFVLVGSKLTADIPVSELEVARDFYGGKLGLELIKQIEGNELRFRVGDAILATYITEAAGKAAHTLASFRVDDLDRAMADLRAAGIEFEEYDLPDFKTVDGVIDWGHTREAWFKDPDGNVLSVGQLIEP